MATIRKREGKNGVSYQIDYFDPNGKRVRQSFKKKKDAEAELGKRVSLIAEKRYLDVKKDYKTTLGELLEKYTENYEHQACFQSGKRWFIDGFKAHFEGHTRLSNIRYVDLETYRNLLRQKVTWFGGIRTNAAVNRQMSCLHHIFAKGVEWEMMERSPFDKGKSLRLKENNTRYRFLDQDEINRLLTACDRKYTQDVVMTVLHTGMRRQEVLGLKWDQIKGGFLYLGKTKTDKARQIPIDKDLAELLKGIRKRNQLRSEHVFCDNRGKPFATITTSFKRALRKAHIEDFKFHDLRHTFASHFVMRGGKLKTLKKILGHKTIQMTMRYAHLSSEFTREEIECMNGLTAGGCHKTVTFSEGSQQLVNISTK
jgi:integrase